MPTLGLALIVKDEEKDLPVLLDSVKGVFDEIVVIDTGSTDRTKKIAADHKARVFDFRWIDDFAAARNFSFSKITSEWTCWFDADDVLKPADRQKLLDLKPRLGDADAYLLPYNYAQDEFGNSTCMLFRHRILRTSGKVQWRLPIHEHLAIPFGWRQERTDIVVTHRRTPEAANRDLGRNLRILEKAVKAAPQEQRLRFYFARELEQAGRRAEAIREFETYLASPPDFVDNKVVALTTLAQTYLFEKQEAKSIDTCFRGMGFDPRWAEFYITMGHVHYERALEAHRTGQYAGTHWQTAAHWYEIASRLKVPDTLMFVLQDHYTWVPLDRLCKCYAELGRFFEANEANEKVLKFRPGDARFLANRAYLRDVLYDRLNERPYRLNLGGGEKPVPSYRNCDLFPGVRVEFRLDQCRLPYDDGTVQAIYSEHALEHAPSHDAARLAVTEWARALRYGGRLTLKVPDMEECCRRYAQAEDRPLRGAERWTEKMWYRYTIHGIQKGQGSEPDEGQYHRTGFAEGELGRLLEQNGFAVDYLGKYDGWGTPSLEARAIFRGRKASVRWLVRGGSPDDPSTRIRRMHVSRWLSENNRDSSFSDAYTKGSVDVGALFAELRRADVVVFTQFSQEDIELASKLAHAGVATVFDMNEDLEGYAGLDAMLDAVRVVVFCSAALKEKHGENRTGFVIPDAWEEPPQKAHAYDPHGKGGKVRVLWQGMGGNAQNAAFLRPICQELGMEFVVMSEWPSADWKWSLNTWLNRMNDADIVVSPQRMELQPCKSNTKATQPMALGIPVVASPMRAYAEAIRHGENGFLCAGPEEWKATLLALRDDQALREKIGNAAKDSVMNWSLPIVGVRWFTVIESLVHETANGPQVDIVIPTYNNLEYLKTCIESVRKNTDWPYNLIVVNSGTDGTAEWLAQQPDIGAHNSPDRLHFSAANNVGLKLSTAPYACLLNDDTIVAEGWLPALMHEAMKPGIGAVGPFSNCDQGWTHQEKITVAGRDLHPGMSLPDVQPVIPSIYKWRHRKEVHPRGWVAFYCTVIPRGVIDKVGLLDEGFKSGDEDLDYCRRIGQAGYAMRQTYDSFVFHFGGRTRKLAENENAARHQAEDRENHDYYRAKWGDFGPLPVPEKRKSEAPRETATALEHGGNGHRKTFVLYTGKAWERWSPRSVDEGGIGGSETCAVYAAREFARKGWRSVVFGDCAGLEGEYDGVRYIDHPKFRPFIESNRIDFFVSSRRADILDLPIRAEKKAVWVHDVWLDADPKADLRLSKLDKIFLLSPWHKSFFTGHHQGVPEEKIHVTRNAIDLGRFSQKLNKVPGRMIYSSSPDRGLETLLDMMPEILERVPDAELHVFYGFENWLKSAQEARNGELVARIEKLRARLQEPGVVYRGRVGQKALAREFLKAELWAYPTWFTETFCISALEAMASGTPIVTTDVAALQTTVGDAGIQVPVVKNMWGCGMTDEPKFRKVFLDLVVMLLTDAGERQKLAAAGLAKAARFGWDGIVEDWLGAVGLDVRAAAEPAPVTGG